MIIPRTPQTSCDVADHYDELDRVYRRIWGEHVHHGYWGRGNESPVEAVVALVDLVAERLGATKDQSVCDIGCGYGATAARLAEQRQWHVTGVTLSARQAEYAKTRPDPERRLDFFLRDWLDNGFPDARFDHAYAIESSEHMPDKGRFFAEAFRTLRPGGRLVICAWLARTGSSRWEVEHLLEPICREGRLPGMGTREDYELLAHDAGFELLGFDDISREVRKTWSICARRLIGAALTDRATLSLLASPRTRYRSFALSLPRLIWSYRTGAMRYGLFVLRR
jgi:tocopherol O-methyltransferase